MLIAASVLMAVIAAVHSFIGTKTDLGPLLDSDTPEPAKSTLFYCWHLISILLFVMAAMLALAAYDSAYLLFATVVLWLSVAFALWGIVAGLLRRRSLVFEMPQGLMFGLVSALTAWAIF